LSLAFANTCGIFVFGHVPDRSAGELDVRDLDGQLALAPIRVISSNESKTLLPRRDMADIGTHRWKTSES
jgi:hypothetical protein